LLCPPHTPPENRDKLVPLLGFLPLVGPSLYLLLRPKTYPLGGKQQ
jgi:hypothetical protein